MGHVENGSWFSDYSGEEIDSRLSLLKNVSRQTALIGDTENNKARGANVTNAAAIGTGLEVSGYGLAFGKYNVHIPTPGHLPPGGQGYFIEEVGNGTDENNRSNARTLDWNGNERLAGKSTIGALPTDAMDVVPLCLLAKPNLLDNAYFVGGGTGYGVFPVNQRGQTQYSNAGFCVDRWYIPNAVTAVNVLSDGVELSAASGSNTSELLQLIDNPDDVKGQTATISALIKVGDTVSLLTATGNVPSTNPGSTTNTIYSPMSAGIPHIAFGYWTNAPGGANWYFTIRNKSTSTVKVLAVKLERGSIQTLAHQESGAWVLNRIPRYAYELLKCYMFLYRYTGMATATALAGSNVTAVTVPFPMTMRANPTISDVTYYDSKVANGNSGSVSGARFYNSNSVSFTVTGFLASAELLFKED